MDYSTKHPWKEARLEVRRLLALGGDNTRKAIKLTYLYVQKNDIGDGHEYPMYLFLGGDYAWALRQYREFLRGYPKAHTHAYLALASCYRHFGEYEQARRILDIAIKRLPDPPWHIAREADIHDAMGDLHAEIGNRDQARQHYREAIRLYPTSPQPYGRHLLRRHAAKVQTKLDLLDYEALKTHGLRDGIFRGRSLAYGGDIDATVTVRGGRIADIKLAHKEKIDLNATTIIPKRIIDAQSVKVDGITGATVTCQSIMDATFQALKKARRK